MLAVVVLVLALLVAVVATVAVIALRVWREVGQLRGAADAASVRLGALGDELSDEIAVLEREQEALQGSVARLRAERARRS